jgi:hypothetical protein
MASPRSRANPPTELDSTQAHHDFEVLFSRLGKQEQVTARLETGLDAVRQSMTAVLDGMKELRLSVSRGTDWGMLAAWAGVILLTVGYVGNLVVSPLQVRVDALEAAAAATAPRLAIQEERVRWLMFRATGIFPGGGGGMAVDGVDAVDAVRSWDGPGATADPEPLRGASSKYHTFNTYRTR